MGRFGELPCRINGILQLPYARRYWREFRAAARTKVLTVLGAECLKCGYNENPLALVIDHISDDGAAHRRMRGRRGADLAVWVIRHPQEAIQTVQTLCANCNHIKQQEKYLWQRNSG